MPTSTASTASPASTASAEPNRTVVHGAAGLTAAVGQTFGPSSWIEVTQERVNQFASATDDHQWIHVDPVRAASGPFGGPIAHGYLTLSLTPVVLTEILDVQGFSLVVNYGCDRVRFPAPVRVGSRLRASAVLDGVRDIDGGVQASLTLTFQADGADKPACVAAILIRYYS